MCFYWFLVRIGSSSLLPPISLSSQLILLVFASSANNHFLLQPFLTSDDWLLQIHTAFIALYRKLQEDLTDEMVVLAQQLKDSSLLMSQSLKRTDKVTFTEPCLVVSNYLIFWYFLDVYNFKFIIESLVCTSGHAILQNFHWIWLSHSC